MLESMQRKGEFMPVKLPAPVAAYIAVENGDDAAALAHCFAENAVVQDEGRTMKGLAAIQRWNTGTKRKHHHTVEPLASFEKDGKTVVKTRLTGEVPGSPGAVPSFAGLRAMTLPRLR